ncbi:MAG: DNA replication/repair protein RecF [Candidatus Hydrogenedentes bacterium]|nr:DNA replication/repair protein RecF [Candidatus Hydrogenedentota bacterium]
MRLNELTCSGFRCLGELQFLPIPGVNIVHGRNAQGKTSLLEAAYFAVTSKSHRTNTESELVRHNHDRFQIRAEVARRDREVRIEVNWWQGTKRIKVNHVALSRVSDLLGRANIIFFSPEDIALIQGAASVRRRFFDMEMAQLQPSYLAALQQYRQVLRQRNQLLRQPTPDLPQLEAWDEPLARHGAVLIEERRKFLRDLAPLATRAYAHIAPDEPVEIRYHPDVPDAAALPKTLLKARNSDLRQGVTNRGPHRDDFEVYVSGKPARIFASQGQQKTAALALRLAEIELVHDRTREYPILMLDEVMAELDAARAERLLDSIHPDVQCVLTTTNLNASLPSAQRASAHFLMQGGRLETR